MKRSKFGRLAVAAAAFLALATLSAPAAAQMRIGEVTRIQGNCQAMTGDEARPLADGTEVFLDDRITTGDGARLEVSLTDGTVLTVGANAELSVDTFVWQPDGSENRLAVAAVGAFRFVSGRLPARPQAVASVATPLATIGIRGTDFWGGPVDGEFGVFLLEGAVSVANAAGETVLSEPGAGTNIAGPGAPPGPSVIWAQDKVDRAFATVAFQ